MLGVREQPKNGVTSAVPLVGKSGKAEGLPGLSFPAISASLLAFSLALHSFSQIRILLVLKDNLR
jgi:hypothetical protein